MGNKQAEVPQHIFEQNSNILKVNYLPEVFFKTLVHLGLDAEKIALIKLQHISQHGSSTLFAEGNRDTEIKFQISDWTEIKDKQTNRNWGNLAEIGVNCLETDVMI